MKRANLNSLKECNKFSTYYETKTEGELNLLEFRFGLENKLIKNAILKKFNEMVDNRLCTEIYVGSNESFLDITDSIDSMPLSSDESDSLQ